MVRSPVEVMQVTGEILDHVHHSRGQGIGAIGQDVRKRLTQEAQALAHGDAALEQEGSDLVDDRGALADQARTHPMQRLQVKLLDTLGGQSAWWAAALPQPRPRHRGSHSSGP